MQSILKERADAEVGNFYLSGNPRKTYFQHFESIVELDDTEPADINRRHFDESVVHKWGGGDTSWWGCRGAWHGVRELVTKGWPEGLERGRALMRELDFPPAMLKSVRRRKRKADSGDSLDIHRVYQGELDKAWTQTYRDQGAMALGQSISIVVDVCAPAMAHADQLFWNGATAAVVVDALQRSGRSCELVATFHTMFSHEMSVMNSVVVKPMDRVMDPELLFACTALAGFSRGYMFKAADIAPYRCPGSYGHIIRGAASPFFSGQRIMYIDQCWDERRAKARIEKLKDEFGRADDVHANGGVQW